MSPLVAVMQHQMKKKWKPSGPGLMASADFYYFDGSTTGECPTHDPCGTGELIRKKGVDNPWGRMFLRLSNSLHQIKDSTVCNS